MLLTRNRANSERGGSVVRPRAAWTPTPVMLGWLAALFASAALGLLTDRFWNPTSALGTSVASASVQSAEGLDPLLPGQLIWQRVLIQIPMWLIMSLVVWMLLRRHKLGFREGLGFSQRWFDIPLGVAVGFLSQFILVRIVYWPFGRFIDTDDVSAPARQLVEGSQGQGGLTLLIIAVVVVAPFLEEVYFRGLLLRSIWSRMGPSSTVLITGALFGLAHLQLLQLPALVAFGLVTSVLVVRFGRLGPALWAHATFNCYSLVVLLI